MTAGRSFTERFLTTLSVDVAPEVTWVFKFYQFRVQFCSHLVANTCDSCLFGFFGNFIFLNIKLIESSCTHWPSTRTFSTRGDLSNKLIFFSEVSESCSSRCLKKISCSIENPAQTTHTHTPLREHTHELKVTFTHSHVMHDNYILCP